MGKDYNDNKDKKKEENGKENNGEVDSEQIIWETGDKTIEGDVATPKTFRHMIQKNKEVFYG